MKELQTPCFILDKQELVNSIIGYQQALSNCFEHYRIGYSVKTNSLPYCLSIVKEYGCFAEVVSYDEYELALQCGFLKNHVIYNGPMKSRETFIDAITNGAIVNIESHRELEWLKSLPRDRHYSVGLRLNVNISKVSPEDADGENDNSRFGFSDDTEEFNSALEIINHIPNVRLSGLHIHRTAHSRSIRFYQNSIRYACETIKKYNLNLDYLDIGGGYYGIFRDKPTYQEYANAFRCVLANYDLGRLTVIIEPGNALVASSFSFLCEVLDVKHIENKRWFITIDGSRNDIDPFFHKGTYMTEIKSHDTGPIVDEQIISGCTCLEYDRLFSLNARPLLDIGDRILFKNVGAYTMCLSPLFIRFFPNVYVIDNNKYALVRERWTVNEYIQKTAI